MNKKEIIKKVEEGKTLTLAEERFYMIEVLGYSKEEADNQIAIISNKNPNLKVD